ncbi:MAG TPA: ATP-binding protein, partial [Planctomycetaceae bacterium]|nr:ATP-binding protein [Planctomycetaceae bacterium]
MGDRFLLKIVVPLVGISLMLLGLGAVAAWNVQNQQAVSSTLITREVESMLAAQDVYVGMLKIRHQLNQYLRSRDRRHFDEIPKLHTETERQLELAKSLARTADEQQLIGVVYTGYARFWKDFQRINEGDFEGDQDAALAELIDTTLTETILVPGHRYIEYNRGVVERTTEASRTTSNQMRRGFLLLGVCGGAGGLVAGLGIARAISRSIVQLDVSVRSVAGKLNQVAGPVQISRVGGFRELEAGLEAMEDHITAIVERLQRSEMEVLRNEQLAAVGQLAAGIAHELRNPLMPMKMLVQAALDRDDGRGLHGRQLEVVEEEIVRLEHSIQMFLDFARPIPLEKSSFDLVGIIEQTLELVAGRAEQQGVVLRDKLPSEPLLIEADCGQIRQVLLNLLLNALDAQPDGGEILIELEYSIPPGAGGQAPCLVLRVSDSGDGLPEPVLERVFEPFVTTKETGTGLGLSICQRIITAHGGEIRASNRSEGGAQFTISLPCPAAS